MISVHGLFYWTENLRLNKLLEPTKLFTTLRMNANTSERLVLAGERKSGQSVRSENVTAVSAIANIVKVSIFAVLGDFSPIFSHPSAQSVWTKCWSTRLARPLLPMTAPQF